MTQFIPGQRSAQAKANQIAIAAETAGGRVMNIDEDGDFQAGVFFTQEQWQAFIMLLLQDLYS